MHFAKHAIQSRERVQKGTALLEGNERIWKTYEEIRYDSDPFVSLGKAFEEVHNVKCATIGLATCKLMGQQELVGFAREWPRK